MGYYILCSKDRLSIAVTIRLPIGNSTIIVPNGRHFDAQNEIGAYLRDM
jgi:hypothetical protein